MKCPVYEMSGLWNVQSMKCLVYEMSGLWNVRSMNCTSMKCPSMKCPVYELYVYEMSVYEMSIYEMSQRQKIVYIHSEIQMHSVTTNLDISVIVVRYLYCMFYRHIYSFLHLSSTVSLAILDYKENTILLHNLYTYNQVSVIRLLLFTLFK